MESIRCINYRRIGHMPVATYQTDKCAFQALLKDFYKIELGLINENNTIYF